MKNATVFFGSPPTAFIAMILSSPWLLSGLFLLTVSPVPLQGSSPTPETPPAAGATLVCQDGEAAFRIARLGPNAAQIQCRVHQIEGDITPEGLSLRSTREADAKAALRFVSEYLGRHSGALIALPHRGLVEVDDSTVVRFVRPNCTEEFRVGLDGIRQDFIISRPPAGPGLLRLELKVQGARVEERGGRLELHFDEADRVLTYGRLHVEDASGKPLPADMVRVDSERIALRVDDSIATYPLRIDPTFSDANWTGLGGFSGTDASVQAIVVDDTGNVYIGVSILSAVGNVPVQQIAMWDGTRWSDLGEGLPIAVDRLLIFENSLYAAGQQTGMPGYRVVKREGSVWVPVGGGFNGRIEALKPHLGSLHAAGRFSTIDGVAVSSVARWDGTTWHTVGTGLFGLAFDILSFDGDLIAGGAINTTGALTSTRVARWNKTS